MRWLPLISREHHEAVVAAKDQHIRALEEQVEAQNLLLEKPVKVTVEMPPDFALLRPAIVTRREEKPTPVHHPASTPVPIDWGTVDLDDPEQIARVAMIEHGDNWRTMSPQARANWLQRVRRLVREARQKRDFEFQQGARVSTIGIAPDEDESIDAPEHVRAMIAAAEGA